MADMPQDDVLTDVMDLAALLRPSWPQISAGITGPRCEGEDPAPDPEPAEDPPPSGDPTGDEDPDEPVKKDDDWQAKARKHERDLKKERKEAEALRAKLAEREQADMSEHERAVAAAREEGKSEGTKAARERLLKAEVRAQAAGKFANPALAIKLLDLDEGALFDDEGEIDADAIRSAVDDFLEQEPGLRAGAPNGGRPTGSADGGRGSGGSKSLEDMSVEDHLKSVARSK